MPGVSIALASQNVGANVAICRGHLPVWDAPSPILDEEARSTKGPSAESYQGETFSI